jgi:OOP family OmpA-OmpF porin
VRSSALTLAFALAFGTLAAGCAGSGAPVCQPVLSWAAPAYACGPRPPAAEAIVDTAPPPPPPEPEPPPEPVLATIGESTIDLAEKIRFEVNSPKLLPASESLLDHVAVLLFDHPELARIRIDGHTDSQGNNAANLKLSQARAEAVRAYLERAGVEPKRLTAKGFGETSPIADNRTPEGREQNRRVEITILVRR